MKFISDFNVIWRREWNWIRTFSSRAYTGGLASFLAIFLWPIHPARNGAPVESMGLRMPGGGERAVQAGVLLLRFEGARVECGVAARVGRGPADQFPDPPPPSLGRMPSHHL